MSSIDDDTITGSTDLEALRHEALAPLTTVADWGAATSIGRVRPENEDAFGHLGNQLFMIADGMGGHAGGRLAASSAVQGVLSTAGSVGLTSLPNLIRSVSRQVRVVTRARDLERAGTTLIVVRAIAGVVTIANIGDSRVYRLRGAELLPLTTDHTVAAELAATGVDLAKHRNVGLHALTRYVGAADGNDVPDVTSLVPHAGDRLLMLTDGVFKQLDDAEICDSLRDRSPSHAAAELIARADRAGGRDNATALIVDFAAGPTPEHRDV